MIYANIIGRLLECLTNHRAWSLGHRLTSAVGLTGRAFGDRSRPPEFKSRRGYMTEGCFIFSFASLLLQIAECCLPTALCNKRVSELVSIRHLSSSIPGPVASVLCTRFGYRVVAVAGAVLAIGGFISASYAPNIELLTLTYGIISDHFDCHFDRYRLFLSLSGVNGDNDSLLQPVALPSGRPGVLRIRHRDILLSADSSDCSRPTRLALVSTDTGRNNDRLPAGGLHLSTPDLRQWYREQNDLRGFGVIFPHPVAKEADLHIAAADGFFINSILIPFNYIPLTSLERNLTESQAAWLVSIMGATNTAGRVLVGAAAFKLPVHPFVFMIVVNALGAVGTFLSVWCKTFVLLAVYCGFFGIVFATDAVLCTIVLARTLGEENLSGSFGLFCLIRGVTGIIVTPVAGTLHDITGQYRASFFLAASALALLAILNVIALIVAKRQETRSYQIQEDIHGSE
ncbi:hypothetical protein LSH36_224g02006 [Paralvinella palmiformis]|uniref:Monocarboxylate transporter n=1 Tax=Paralvinella palmiformis TaxID=53620 RepID=A0AAD9JP39_9ANNE|nr:hypothetical protein LSH36_224g02006 [Paralvinella palmiformis]